MCPTDNICLTRCAPTFRFSLSRYPVWIQKGSNTTQELQENIKMMGYTKVTLAEGIPNKYEHRVKVDDFNRTIKRKHEIRSQVIEIFPGLKVEFVIRKAPKPLNGVQYFKQGVPVYAIEPDVLFFLEIEKQNVSESDVATLAGEVKVNMDGEVGVFKIGDYEKDVYEGFTKGKITINTQKGYNKKIFGFSFYKKKKKRDEKTSCIYSPNTDEKTSLEVDFTLYNPGMLLVTS